MMDLSHLRLLFAWKWTCLVKVAIITACGSCALILAFLTKFHHHHSIGGKCVIDISTLLSSQSRDPRRHDDGQGVVTPQEIADYFYWTNASSCRLTHDIGGVMIRTQGSPSGLDGQKAVCLDPAVAPKPGNCTVYSFGINVDWSFDNSMREYGCEVFAFDPFIYNEDHLTDRGVHFYNLGIADQDHSDEYDRKFLTLSAIYWNLLRHGGRVIDYLKLDIETGEWRVLPEIIASGMLSRVRQLSVEFHWSNTTDLPGFLSHYNLLKTIENQARMVRFDSKYNPWFVGRVPALDTYDGPLGFEIAWYQVLPN